MNWLELNWVKPQYGALTFTFFLVLSFLPSKFTGMGFVLGLIACTGVVMMLYKTKKNNPLARYTMPIFLMHTIFAAPVRSLLLKMGIGSAGIHITVGLAISFAGSILAAIVMSKVKYLDFFLYPGKYIKIGVKK